jgi:hypothetical protein
LLTEGRHIEPQYYAEHRQPVSFAIKELAGSLHITTYYAQYTKCAAAHFLYTQVATDLLREVISPLERLPTA